MRWQNRRRSQNVDDRRNRQGSSAKSGIKLGKTGMIVLVLISMYFGVDPRMVLNLTGLNQTNTGSPQPKTPANDKLAGFVSVVLADTEDTWNQLFNDFNRRYKEPVLVLFTNKVYSACGHAEAAMGPFYCPADQKIYIDLGFYQQLKTRHQAPGDFAQAYVIAHEVGHHVQNLLGISSKVREMQRGLSNTEANKLSVKLELQADCFSGLWAHHTEKAKQILEAGDVEEALNAASAIGDDRLQKQARGYSRPESFTHGRSDQRVKWFKTGLETGSIKACNTF